MRDLSDSGLIRSCTRTWKVINSDVDLVVDRYEVSLLQVGLRRRLVKIESLIGQKKFHSFSTT